MIKNSSFRRILLASISLIIISLTIYIFPENEIKIRSNTSYKKAHTSYIYLVDEDDYVARTIININSNSDKTKEAKELLNALINGSNKNKYLPKGFKSYIPSSVKVNDVKIENDTIIVDFNDKLFIVGNKYEEKILETIVYTLTEIDGIKYVKILINGDSLSFLPSSNKKLPDVLSRDIGINKKSVFSSFKNIKYVTTYFLKNNNNEKYYVPITFITDDSKDKIEIIIKELESSENIDNNLITYLNASVSLKNYEILENELNVEFNNAIFNSFDKIDEEVMYGIALSIYDSYSIPTVGFIVDGKKTLAYARKTT